MVRLHKGVGQELLHNSKEGVNEPLAWGHRPEPPEASDAHRHLLFVCIDS